MIQTQKQKLSQMVLQKMKEKKQELQRNRPHYQVLQLDVKFSLQQNQSLKKQISCLSEQLNAENQQLGQLQRNLQELQNTGKKKYPLIIIKPQFIASQNIPINFKQFYRKASNTFLRVDIIKTQRHEIYLQRQKQILGKIFDITEKQKQKVQTNTKNIKTMQQKRTKILKQDVKRRYLIGQQNGIIDKMQKLRSQNESLLREYQIKKQNLQNRISHNEQLAIKIKQQKVNIQTKYNPVTYREYLKKVFDVRIKNQHMEKNLMEVVGKLSQTKKLADKYRFDLEEKFSIIFLGKTLDSPSKSKGRIQNSLIREKQRQSQANPESLTQLISMRSCTSKSVTRTTRTQTKPHGMLEEDNHVRILFKKKGNVTNRNHSSMKTLRNTFKSTELGSDRTMSTTFAMSTTTKKVPLF